jgi:hypothetical protein
VSTAPGLFAFERDYQSDLRCIPMVLRHRLDECGIKLSLKEWVKLGPEQRAELLAINRDVDTRTFADEVENRVQQRMGAPPAHCPIDPSPAWSDTSRVPDDVAAKAAAEGIPPITAPQWAALAPLQRFALLKLSRSSHKNENFVPACREFGILAP